MKHMPRRFCLLLFLICILTGCLTVTALAGETEITDPMTLTVSDEMGITGDTVEVTITLSNNKGLASLIFEVEYDDYLTLTDVKFNEELFRGITFVKDESAEYSNPQRISFMSPTEENTDNGSFATLVFTVSEGAPDDYLAEVSISSYDPENIFDGEFNNIPLICVGGEIAIYRGLPGDVNEDGEVNNKDAISLFRYVAGSSAPVDSAALDVNGDGEINNKDAITLFRYVAGWEGIVLHRGVKCEHNYQTVPDKAATCTEDGYTRHTECTVCGDKIGYIRLPASHSYDSVSPKGAKCTESGHTAYEKCSVCGDRRGYAVIDALGHLEEHHDAKQPTCEAPGWNAYETCTRCDYTTYEEIPALGHDYATVPALDATCYEDGHTEYLDCTRCDSVIGYQIVPASHKYVDVLAKKATCTENGYEAHQRCSACGDLVDFVEILAAHEYIPVDGQPASCIDGYITHNKCEVCGDIAGYEVIPAVGHVANSDHACIGCGLKEYCIVVNYIYVDGSIAAECATLNVWEGDAYCIASPEIDGFIRDVEVVSGCATQNTNVTVTYFVKGTLFGGYDECGDDEIWNDNLLK